MLLFETIDRINRTHSMIQSESTGTPEEFANKLNISRRHLFNLLNELKEYGADIRYNRKKKAYSYQNDFVIKIELGVQPLSEQEEKSISGGYSLYNYFGAMALH